MNLGERLLPGLAMEVVDILRDDEFHDAHRFELGERGMAGVRLRHLERLEQLVILPADALLPRLFGIFHEALTLIHWRLAVLGPKPARTAKRRDAALHRHAGAGQRDRIVRAQ